MSYSRVSLIDGAGTNSTINAKGELSIADGLKTSMSAYTTMIGLTVTLAVAADSNRRGLYLSNKGTSNIWLGATITMSAGATGINFDALTASSNTTINNYTGNIYAILGPGVSSNQQPLGIASFT